VRLLPPLENFCLRTGQYRLAWVGLTLLVVLGCLPCNGGDGRPPGKRRITVKDTIEMTEFADRGYFLGGAPESAVAIFSPNGKQFLIRLKKGSVERNVVQYSLLLFQTGDAFQSPVGHELLTMSSSSNREAIQQVRWLDDQAVAFLGENTGERPQVYRVAIPTKQIIQLTHHPTAVVSYDISRDGREIVYEATPQTKKLVDTEQVRRNGWVVTSQYVSDLLDDGEVRDGPWADRELFVQPWQKKAVRIPSTDFLGEYLPLVLSPDGHYALLAVYLSDVPQTWGEYDDKVLHQYIVERRKPGTLSNIQQYMLLDVSQRKLVPLLDAPKAWLDEGIAWSSDSRSVAVSGTYLPLDSDNAQIQADRKAHAFVVDVDVPGGKIQVITGERLRIAGGNEEKHRITLAPGYYAEKGPLRAFEKINTEWRSQPMSATGESQGTPVNVTLEEDKNTPPKIFVADRNTGRKNLLLDLNPQFRDFKFAIVETVKWKAADGHEVIGGLYFPPDYQEGRRYPLVIQTHGYEEDRFWMNGPWNSAFAAQPLAARGIMVLQVGDSTERGADRNYTNTPGEGPRRMAAFEGAIDELDRRGLIDTDRVGLIGFSRTVFHVAFTLTHSKYRFRAATLADGFDGGYLNYLLWRIADSEGVNGGEPIGAGLKSWLDDSPGFRIDKVSAPVRIEYYGPHAFLGGWMWFSLLSLLEKPVDFIWIPHGTHLLVKPWERMTSEQGSVDWFCFWLKGEEDADPTKAEQTRRWRELLDRRRDNKENRLSAAPN
jgi:dipeptidyl aminopeptidase/acylaminoacyl peptidase